MQPSKKTFKNLEGRWIEKPTATLIVVCACGGKYIKSRELQTMCVRCMSKIVTK